jgi:hypothetical protein
VRANTLDIDDAAALRATLAGADASLAQAPAAATELTLC